MDGNQVELTAREFVLAETFLRHPGQVFSREQLGAGLIDTVRGVGYRLATSSEASR